MNRCAKRLTSPLAVLRASSKPLNRLRDAQLPANGGEVSLLESHDVRVFDPVCVDPTVDEPTLGS